MKDKYNTIIQEYEEMAKNLRLVNKIIYLPILFYKFKNGGVVKGNLKKIGDDLLNIINPTNKHGLNFHLLKYIGEYSSILSNKSTIETNNKPKENIANIDFGETAPDPETIPDMKYDKELCDLLGIKSFTNSWETENE